MMIWEQGPCGEPWRPPQSEVLELLREADADMPSHIEDFTDQTAYLVGVLMDRWPSIGAPGALALVRELRHRLGEPVTG